MKCFAAHCLYLGQGELLTNQVVCFDEKGCITSIQPLKEEIPSTIFLNGLLCAAFSLPGSKEVLSVGEAVALLGRVRDLDPLLQVTAVLESYTGDSELKVGSAHVLWCIDPIDLKKLLLLHETSVYSVFP